MLSSLFIRNYAIIRELEVEFNTGLSTITGETGAGKSILLGALSLILGQRADLSVLKDKDSKCIIEGDFTDAGIVEKILRDNDIENSEPLILRREISPNGKSRAFVNDTPVNLPLLKSLGDLLVDIHSQHESLNLNNNLYQLHVIDAFAKNKDHYLRYREEFKQYQQINREYKQLVSGREDDLKELDFLTFQFGELENAKLSEGELEEMENELDSLQHTEEIKQALNFSYSALTDEQQGVTQKLKQVESELNRAAKHHSISGEIKDRLSSCLIELKDLTTEIEYTGERIEHDPDRQVFLEERIGAIYSLMKKHNISSEKDLLAFQEELKRKINELNSHDFRIEELGKKRGESLEKLGETAQKLSATRLDAIPRFQKRITELLKQLGIPNAVFKVQNDLAEEPGEEGYDNIRFLFTANKKTELQDISHVASGGEMSRLMLSLKYVISDSSGLPTIIFDEVDSGVSGEIAHRVSLMLKEMAVNLQVFAITHLPQVAAMGNHQYQVFKTDDSTFTETRLRLLGADERLSEIAKMLSGKQTTRAALENAKELLGM